MAAVQLLSIVPFLGPAFKAVGLLVRDALAFLGGGQSSASVCTGSEYVALFGTDLARKVASSVPIEGAETAVAPARHLRVAQCPDR